MAAIAAAAWSCVREDVAAAPGDLGAELGERLDQHGRLNRHVQAAGDAGPGERLRLAVLLAQRHQAGHFVLGQHDLLAAQIGQGEVGDFVGQTLFGGGGHVGIGLGLVSRARNVQRKIVKGFGPGIQAGWFMHA